MCLSCRTNTIGVQARASGSFSGCRWFAAVLFLTERWFGRRPRWLLSAQEPAAGNAAAAADSEVAAGGARRSRDTVAAADSRGPIR